MKLYPAKFSIRKPYSRDALPLPPPATTVGLSKKRPNLDARTCRDSFNLLDPADDIDLHFLILSEILWAGKTS